ncbi:tryptophan 7-halogenase [Colwellia sp. MB02u-18]|uniref:tryptophan halogenase family protein n=1 Tax=unclassified Colwellia TaxID=196834 RepID=UPI0015F55EB1|nr:MULTISPECIES: tryptophan halogenase family protein [unclassified Colwellia]MBA6225377.1 tryptophan 7-halogenase [Colwellia sp. MB3u-45]MBA6265979.1 tryptophan 7-halogenase [Colwellia sp. MB3u-43]MBA6320756.1 tryptophan 7-halogenase [Colwellia sp. MB02u-19]MBA6323306.1 tryptophan 7-halogenase [Colwellia sp. MB02u-18]MBA6329673.1 tryptophan 7-halogenase [Colwellia sp. MB02u-12]
MHKNNTQGQIKNIVIVGGGTAGWMTASLLAKVLGKTLDITLVESDNIGIVGVGEATIPPIVNFNSAIGIDEKAFIKATKGTMKLGIEFNHWHQDGEHYMHAFGSIGKKFPFCDFHHFWQKHQQLQNGSDNIDGNSFWDYSLNYQAAKQGKFAPIKKILNTNLPGLAYAYHFDAGLYAKFLRKHAEGLGVKRIEGTITDIAQDDKSGDINSVTLEDGTSISGDLFIDCTGLAAILIEKTLSTGYDDYSHWLPCDRAIAVACEKTENIEPYTRSTAHKVGWQWRIPLQHRTGNGLVYASKHMSDEEAKALLLKNIDGKPLAEPKIISFKTGRRRKQWNKNVIAIGLSSGFFEPLEATNIHLIQTAATRLVKFFPHQGINLEEVNEFNRQSKVESEGIRDFIILHYKLNNRGDSEFWRACQRMDVPESLMNKIQLFKKTGKVFCQPDDLFTETAWQQVMIGQGNIPEDHHPLVDTLSEEQVDDLMKNLKILINRTVDKMPSHDDFLRSL